MNILLTGSTGFLGKNLALRLSLDGHSLIPFGRSTDTSEVEKADAIINCAADLDDSERMIDSNLFLVFRLLEYAKNQGVAKFIQIGSSSETGPIEGPRSETTFCRPTNMYEATKLAATNLCLGYAGQYGLDVCVARPFSLYGPNDKPRKFLPTLKRAAEEGSIFHVYPGGHDWLHVNDFVKGIIALLSASSDKTAGQIYHFGTGINTSNSDVIQLFCEVSGKTVNTVERSSKYRSYDVLDWRADWSKAKADLGWHPTISLTEGLKTI